MSYSPQIRREVLRLSARKLTCAQIREVLLKNHARAAPCVGTIEVWLRDARERRRGRAPNRYPMRGRRVWPLDIQRDALDLRDHGLSARRIRLQLRSTYGVAPSHQTIINWARARAAGKSLEQGLPSDTAIAAANPSAELTTDLRQAVIRLFCEERVYRVADICARLRVAPQFVHRVLNADRQEGLL